VVVVVVTAAILGRAAGRARRGDVVRRPPTRRGMGVAAAEVARAAVRGRAAARVEIEGLLFELGENYGCFYCKIFKTQSEVRYQVSHFYHLQVWHM